MNHEEAEEHLRESLRVAFPGFAGDMPFEYLGEIEFIHKYYEDSIREQYQSRLETIKQVFPKVEELGILMDESDYVEHNMNTFNPSLPFAYFARVGTHVFELGFKPKGGLDDNLYEADPEIQIIELGEAIIYKK